MHNPLHHWETVNNCTAYPIVSLFRKYYMFYFLSQFTFFYAEGPRSRRYGRTEVLLCNPVMKMISFFSFSVQ
jgi:hypothetical protein